MWREWSDSGLHWQPLSDSIESQVNLFAYGTCFRVEHANQSRRRDLILWIRTRSKNTQIRLLESVRLLIKEVGKKGWSKTKSASEWDDQKKTQEDQGQIKASVERRRKYEKLGELLSLWDRVKEIR